MERRRSGSKTSRAATWLLLLSVQLPMVACVRGNIGRNDGEEGPPVEHKGHYVREARVVATGIEGAGSVAHVGRFLSGPVAGGTDGTEALEVERALVASTSSYGAAPTDASWAFGSVLSIAVGGDTTIDVRSAIESTSSDAIIWTAHSDGYTNAKNNPSAVTAALPAVSNPLGIMVHHASGRVAVAGAPVGSEGPALVSLLDASGLPFTNVRNTTAGGVFSGDGTGRAPAIDASDLSAGAVGIALLGRSPDQGDAAYAVVLADGRIVQVDVEEGVDGLAPPRTITSLEDVTADAQTSVDASAVRAGALLGWSPEHTLFVADPAGGAVVAVHLETDDEIYRVKSSDRFSPDAFDAPVDLAPTVMEASSPRFASSRTLAAGADLYVADRGNGRVVRVTQSGDVIATADIELPDGSLLGPGRLAGIAVSRDGERLFVTVTSLPATPEAGGALLEVAAFGHDAPVTIDATSTDLEERGAALFAAELTPESALGPLFNGRSCLECHGAPTPGGDAGELRLVSAFGRSGATGFDGMLDFGGPIARAHSVTELGAACAMTTGVPEEATIVSERSSPQLYLSGVLDRIPDEAIAAVAVPWPNGVLGRPSFVTGADGQRRVGRFGWKGDVVTLEEFVATAFRNELGLTNAARPTDLVASEQLADCDGFGVREDDGRIVQAVTAYLATLVAPAVRTGPAHAAGREVFNDLGCQTCHLPNGPTGDPTTPLYSDLLLHDMGEALADGVVQGDAGSRDWRTTPLWGLGSRSHLLHDGRATTIEGAILAHEGEARVSTELYNALSAHQRQALLDFLQSL